MGHQNKTHINSRKYMFFITTSWIHVHEPFSINLKELRDNFFCQGLLVLLDKHITVVSILRINAQQRMNHFKYITATNVADLEFYQFTVQFLYSTELI